MVHQLTISISVATSRSLTGLAHKLSVSPLCTMRKASTPGPGAISRTLTRDLPCVVLTVRAPILPWAWQGRSQTDRPSPRPLDVVEADQAVFGVEDHADRVEADRVGGGADVLLLAQPGGGESAQTGALTRAQ